MTDTVKLKVVLVGPPGVGKTALVRRHVLGSFDDAYRSTLGTNVFKWTGPLDLGGRAVRVAMSVWDMAGESRIPEVLLDIHLYGAQGVLAVCDVTDAGSAAGLAPWTCAVGRVAGDVPVHVLLNKVDLGARDDALFAGLEAGRARAAPCYVTSAKTGDNVAAAFEGLARRIAARTIVPPEGPVDDADRRLALACSDPRSPQDLARARGMPASIAEARLERLRRAGYVQIASLGVDAAGRPRIAYEATGRPYSEPLLVAGR
jgi:small GTP-binding protein